MTATWATRAVPQTAQQVRIESAHPEVVSAARARGIEDVIHFTRVRALTGILSSGAVKARRDLPHDEHVKHVYEENAADRNRDLIWHEYVNLSVSHINQRMFRFSKRSHPGDEWVILKFGPEILGHPGVVFTTSNNAYEVTRRACGLPGFNQMFVEPIPWGYKGSVCTRVGRAPHEPTDPQAEVLYHGRLALEHLHTIVAGDEDTLDSVTALRANFPHSAAIELDSGAFR